MPGGPPTGGGIGGEPPIIGGGIIGIGIGCGGAAFFTNLERTTGVGGLP